MLKDKTLTYISLFSSAGVGCYGFKQENYKCIATNEFIERRINVQKYNKKCDFESGYICGDIKSQEIKNRIFNEIEKYKKLGNDGVDVLIATPPCQGMSVANHKKAENEIERNSLVVESITLTKEIKPKFFIFENVSSFLTTGCTTPDKEIKEIQQVIHEELDDKYAIIGKILNFKNYGSNSSRTRTLVIGVRNDYKELISPLDLFPDYQKEKTLKEVIGDLKSLKWGEISDTDILHSFRTYPKEMENWIKDLKEGQGAFDNPDPLKQPHKVVDGKIILNVNKNGDKYTRQYWNKVAPCIHTRNDQLASQNTVHPIDNRVFSIRELMRMMTIPESFKWSEDNYDYLNLASISEKQRFYKENEIKIRQSIGEAVPTAIFRQIAQKIKLEIETNPLKFNIKKEIEEFDLSNTSNLIDYIEKNTKNLSIALLSKIAEYANSKRTSTDAYYTDKSILNYIYEQLPNFDNKEINILEPSVGTGNFLPYLFKKYETVEKVNLDINDIDCNSLSVLKLLLSKVSIPNNFVITYKNCDFLNFNEDKKYDLIVGNPPFTKIAKIKHNSYYNNQTNNLCALFLEKAILISSNICMVQPKYILNTAEFSKTRELLAKHKINSIYDFGEQGFKGVLIETISVSLETNKKGNSVIVKSIPFKLKNIISQKKLTSNEYPYWIIYRNNYFDNISQKMNFGAFSVFRDRQITNKDLANKSSKNTVRVLRSRNITDTGDIIDIEGYDSYIKLDDLKNKTIYKYFNKEVYLVPNMTYKPRMTENKKECTVNGSVAILIPKKEKPTKKQMQYFSSDEYRQFYRVARNYQTRSLNIDETSVYFFGLLK